MSSVRVDRHDGGVVELVLDRPDAMNTVSIALAEELDATCAQLAADPAVRAVVLTSSVPRVFSAGADLKERAGLTDDELMASRPVSRRAYNAILELPVPTIAAVEGFALGGGLELALSCDILVAGEAALLGLPEVTRGVIPGGGGTQLLARKVGTGVASLWILTGARVEAAAAARAGVVDELVKAGRARPRALELAAQAAAASPRAVRAAKRAIRDGYGLPLREGLEVEDAAWRDVALSDDRREGVAAFVEKREPQWPPAPVTGE